MIVKIYCIILTTIIAINAQNLKDDQEVKTCRTDNGTAGECVPYYLCQNGKIITDGRGLLDIRSNVGCEVYFEECCELEKKLTKEESVIIKGNASYGAECGIRNSQGVLLDGLTDAVQGESQYGEFPWMVALLLKDLINESFVKSYKCGGSLIAKNVVLTAAHYIKDMAPDKLIARMGEWDTEGDYELFPHVDYEVEKIVTNDKFFIPNHSNDIALIFLKTDVKMTETVGTICLPSQDQPIDMTRCFATGWGKKKFEDDKKQNNLPIILKKVELPTVQHDDCQAKLRKTRLGHNYVLDNSFMCAGGEAGVDTCKGDGGSPLVCPVAGVPNKYYQAGIVVWGIGCGDKDVPGIYTNVAKFSNWINEKMASVQF